MSNSNKKAFSKAPTALTALSLIVSLGMLAVLLLFQNGILFSLGFTDVTSDIIVMAITVALAVCAVLSLIAMVKCATANSHNKELVGSVAAKTVYRKDDSEQHNRHGDEKASVAEKAQDEEVHEPAVDDTTEHEPISPIVTAMVNDSVSNETLDDIANVMNGVVKEPETEQNEEPEQGYISEQCDKPVEEEQQPEAAPTEEVQEEPAASEESNGPVSEELPAAEPESEEEHTEAVVDEEPVELTKFEQAMISLMKRGNIPENVYAIEEYKEGAVCLIRDDAHYFVYDCKDNQAQDVEMFEADKEKEIATTFATRIHEKLSKGA